MEIEKDSKKLTKDNLIQNEGLIKESAIIQLPPPSILKPTRSICKIETSIQKSSGFFIKFFKGNEDFFCLLTNEHIITKELIE